MGTPHADAWAIALQVAAANAARGLLVHELGEDPRIGSVMVEVFTSGDCSVTFVDESGVPVGGYSL